MEIWKDLINYEGYYKVSNLGRVKSVDRRVSHKRCGSQFVKGKMMSLKKNRHGYLMCLIQKDGYRMNKTIHRLIAQTFILNPEKKPDVNHINGIKTDNRINNLEWVTKSENMIHSYDSGLSVKNYGEKNGSSKLNTQDVIKIKELIMLNYTCVSISKMFNISSSQIERIKNNVNWVHIK